jgi:hypothetical protein
MIVSIELCTGPNLDEHVTKKDVQKNIDALQRAVDGEPLSHDFVLLLDTMYIIKGIQKRLPD